MRIYVGCAITQAPEEFRLIVENLKRELRSSGHEVLDFLGLTEGTPDEVYNWDIEHCVKTCDLFIAICDYPSIGLGYEIAMALNVYSKKVLAVVHEGVRLTRLIQGINHSDFSLQTVSVLSEVIDLVPRPGEHQLSLDFIKEDVVA